MIVSHSRAILCAAVPALTLALSGCPSEPDVESPAYDLVLRGGTVYDGSGAPPVTGDVAIMGDTIAAVGDLAGASAAEEIDVAGLAVAPGFVNMMSWANESLIEDGRSLSDIHQGVTLEVMGEGSSMGPLNEAMKEEMLRRQRDIRFAVEWTTLGEYMEHLVARGISPNVASFLGAATPRIHVIGHDDRPPTEEELARMRELVRQAMEEGAVGVASSLIYPPGSFADTAELIELAKVAAEHGGLYASHVRGEGRHLVESVEELLTIAREAGIRAEIYHLKASGRSNWHLLDEVIRRVEQARAGGLEVTADVYSYPAGATGLNASMPPWVQEGGFEASLERLRDPALRQRIIAEMNTESDDWENLYLGAGTPDNILLVGFKSEALKPYTGKTLAEVAELRGGSPEETAIDLIVEDESRVEVIYFTQSEDNLRKKIVLPWVSLCSDSASLAPEGVFLKSAPHPRAYGSFARFLGKFVRDEGLLPLEEAIRKMTSLPAATLGIEGRGLLREGYFADVVVFDPGEIRDRATFTEPHQLATGMRHVFVNGVQVLADGEHTGATPGRVVRGPGWTGDSGG
jgi:N-acyl-D-amino-acid deacylase